MHNIIGRKAEQRELEAAYSSEVAEFIAVYGRRRVGKTYLIKNFFLSKKCAFLQNTGIYQGRAEQQLARFTKELESVFYGGATLKPFTNWLDAFDKLTLALSQVPKNKKIVLFFDELPWMATHKSGLLSALEYFWNRHWSDDTRIKLIVCGSAAAWIIKKIIKNRGGLHNRITRRLQLKPFNLHETALYLKHIHYPCTHTQVMKLYAVMGGVPFYLKGINKNESIDQNIDRLFFDPNGLLFDEFNEVFSSLFDASDQYKEIVMLIANYKDGVARSYIEEKNKLTGEGGRLTKRLEDLEHTGFISSYLPYAHKKQGVFYRVSDEYCYFYLRWIAEVKDRLKQGQIKKYWASLINAPDYFSWLGYVFENICYKHLEQIKQKLELNPASLASPWRYKPRKEGESGAQIDLLFERADQAITLCEIKCTEQPFAIDKHYAAQLKQKITVFKKMTKTTQQIFFAFISANGLKETLYSEEFIHGVVVLEDLFKE